MKIQGTWISKQEDLKITISDSGNSDSYFLEYIDDRGISKTEEVPINMTGNFGNQIHYKIMQSELFGIADIVLTDDETMYVNGMRFSRVKV